MDLVQAFSDFMWWLAIIPILAIISVAIAAVVVGAVLAKRS